MSLTITVVFFFKVVYMGILTSSINKLKTLFRDYLALLCKISPQSFKPLLYLYIGIDSGTY